MQPYALCVRTPRAGALLLKRAGERMPEETCVASLRLHHSDHKKEETPDDEPHQDYLE